MPQVATLAVLGWQHCKFGRSVAAEKRLPAFAGMTTMLLLAACTVGPDYQRPAAAVPAAYKEAWKPGPKEAGWQAGQPADAIDRGAWWSIYHDPTLDGLERQIDISNQNLKAAEAVFREAEAIVAEARAGFFPTAQIDAAATRSRVGGAAIGAGRGGSGSISNAFSLDGTASWTPDLWGKIRRTVESNVATAQASAGELASARLSAQGSLAAAYLQLRVADELKRLLEASVKAYGEALRIVKNQYAGGTADQSAVAQAQAQLDGTRAQLIAVGVTRAQLEHAIAVLIGKPPADFAIAPVDTVIAVPLIPAELPSALLERRPDIATAERQMAAANAQIGVAVAAFYPDVTLSADYRGGGGDAGETVHGVEPDLVVRLDPRRDDLRRRLAQCPGRAAARRLRCERRQLPSKRADRLSAGRGPARWRAHLRRSRRRRKMTRSPRPARPSASSTTNTWPGPSPIPASLSPSRPRSPTR